MLLTGEIKVLKEKPVTVPLCPPQMYMGLTGMDSRHPQTGRQLITLAMAQPIYKFHQHISIMGSPINIRSQQDVFSFNICSTLHVKQTYPCLREVGHSLILTDQISPNTALGLTFVEESLNCAAAHNYEHMLST
jgi:hypothetical protein